MRPGRRPARPVGTGSATRKEGGRSNRDQPHHRHGLGQAGSRSAVRQDIDRTAQTRARPGCKPVGRGRAGDRPGNSGPCWLGRLRLHREAAPRAGPRGEGRPEGELGQRREEAPPRMRWRGPPDLAAPDTAISCSWSVPLDQPPSRTPARSPSCPVPLASRGVPRMVSVFGSERFLRPFDAAAQGVSPTNFKILWPSTNCPQSSQSYPLVDSNSPHEVHREPSAARFGIDRAGGGQRQRRPG